MKNVHKLSKFIACDLVMTTGDGSDQRGSESVQMLRLGADAIDARAENRPGFQDSAKPVGRSFNL
jgi:hypothetical protein